jgi:hypothetical protein
LRCGSSTTATGAAWQELRVPLGVAVALNASVLTAPGRRTFTENVVVKQSVTVALGDSYAAGQGNPDVPADNRSVSKRENESGWPFEGGFEKGTRAQWWDEECQRSLISWPVLTVLMQALVDQRQQTRHVLLTYACSGAEVVDGGFLAQIKSSVRGRTLSSSRDGAFEDPKVDRAEWMHQVRRSQINAMFDDLCGGQERRARVVSVPARPRTRAWIYGCAKPLEVNRLMLSMGGNDLGFPNIAMGIFVPSVGQYWYADLGIALFRWIAGARSPHSALGDVIRYSEVYADEIHALREAAGVQASKTVLVRYPNPVVTEPEGGIDKAPEDGCVAGPIVQLPSGKTEKAQRIRVRDINLVLGSALYHGNPLPVGEAWTLSAEPTEVQGFKKVYQRIRDMQDGALKRKDAAGRAMEGATYGEARWFHGRRLCDKLTSPDTVYLPLHMCTGYPGECNAADAMGQGQWRARAPSEYEHYGGMRERQARRTIVYSLNESVLAQRSWDVEGPNAERVRDVLSGAMHPTGEAHAAAADSILKAIEEQDRKNAVGKQTEAPP